MNTYAKGVLAKLRGKGMVCACGRILEPLLDSNGKQLGLLHKTYEDEDYHIWYFTGSGLNPATNEFEYGFNPYKGKTFNQELDESVVQ